MAVPPHGFGIRLDAMYEWHRSRGIEVRRGRGRHEDDTDYVRWCFSDPHIATAFAAEFGGTVIRDRRAEDYSMIVFERALICAAVVVSGSAATAQKVPFENSANALFQGCKAATQNEKLDPQTATVASYCNGVVYALASVSDRLSNPPERSCVPAISTGQTMRVVVKFLDEHPERLHENFVQLALEVFHRTWPCPAGR